MNDMQYKQEVIWDNPFEEKIFWYRPKVHHFSQMKPVDFDMARKLKSMVIRGY